MSNIFNWGGDYEDRGNGPFPDNIKTSAMKPSCSSPSVPAFIADFNGQKDTK